MTIKFDLGQDLERWDVRINRIVTGVTSDVGVPSTRLVFKSIISEQILQMNFMGSSLWNCTQMNATEHIW